MRRLRSGRRHKHSCLLHHPLDIKAFFADALIEIENGKRNSVDRLGQGFDRKVRSVGHERDSHADGLCVRLALAARE